MRAPQVGRKLRAHTSGRGAAAGARAGTPLKVSDAEEEDASEASGAVDDEVIYRVVSVYRADNGGVRVVCYDPVTSFTSRLLLLKERLVELHVDPAPKRDEDYPKWSRGLIERLELTAETGAAARLRDATSPPPARTRPPGERAVDARRASLRDSPSPRRERRSARPDTSRGEWRTTEKGASHAGKRAPHPRPLPQAENEIKVGRQPLQPNGLTLNFSLSGHQEASKDTTLADVHALKKAPSLHAGRAARRSSLDYTAHTSNVVLNHPPSRHMVTQWFDFM